MKALPWAAAWAIMACSAQAAPALFPALGQPALKARAPQRAVLLSAAQAGQRIVAVGERGIVVLSDDGGHRWRQARSVPVAVTLTAMRFVDPKLGWTVGHGGVVLHTADGGETWTRLIDGAALARIALEAAQERLRQAPQDATAMRQLQAAQQLLEQGADKPLLDLWFADASHGFVVGAYGLLFETADGGRNWKSAMERLDNPKGLHLYAIRGRGTSIVLAGEQGLLARSDDGGRSFRNLPSPYTGSWFTLGLWPDGRLLAAGLRGNAFVSADQGQSWQRLDSPAPVSFVAALPLASGGVLLANQAGQVLSASAGGALTALNSAPVPGLADVLALDNGDFLVVGAAGVSRVAAASATAGAAK
ncbi:hypothetical protein EEB15_16895 [Ramlibacter sp. WS9]|nr:hypothetical protein EEB15_16895 [Ramlibacter sp. WS9]